MHIRVTATLRPNIIHEAFSLPTRRQGPAIFDSQRTLPSKITAGVPTGAVRRQAPEARCGNAHVRCAVTRGKGAPTKPRWACGECCTTPPPHAKAIGASHGEVASSPIPNARATRHTEFRLPSIMRSTLPTHHPSDESGCVPAQPPVPSAGALPKHPFGVNATQL